VFSCDRPSDKDDGERASFVMGEGTAVLRRDTRRISH
jgi:hypothetical protein